MTDKEWYEKYNCEHAHCPNGCEKPQPSIINEKMLCMKCLILFDIESEVIPCTPITCE